MASSSASGFSEYVSFRAAKRRKRVCSTCPILWPQVHPYQRLQSTNNRQGKQHKQKIFQLLVPSCMLSPWAACCFSSAWFCDLLVPRPRTGCQFSNIRGDFFFALVAEKSRCDANRFKHSQHMCNQGASPLVAVQLYGDQKCVVFRGEFQVEQLKVWALEMVPSPIF